MNSRKWEILSKLKTPDIAKILLKNRGIKTEKERKEFFEPTTPEKISVKSLSLSQNEINKAIKRIKKALRTKEKVIIYGDYDADGICGTAILWEALYKLGLNILPYIPERFSEGYGLNVDSIKKLKQESPDLGLIITVDHGIVANKKIDLARELGIDVIITDHHLPRLDRRGKPVKPKAYATVHTTKIGGAAVAWILAREILRKLPATSYQLQTSLELVAIGTIADQLPLTHANRSFAKFGLVALQKTKRVGLIALMKKADLEVGLAPRSVYEVGFMIAPRLNAMGRLEHAMESLRLLCTKDVRRAEDLAKHLNRVNLERQRIVEEVVLHAKNSVDKSTSGVIVLSHESYHEGVIGLAASKLVEEFYRPTIVISKKVDVSKASARSINGFNIIDAIRRVEDLLIEGGGHPMAAGFSIKTNMIGKFVKRLNEVSTSLLTEEILTKKLKIDLEIQFNQINWKLLELVRSFEPTGLGNPAPTFATKGVKIVDARLVGRDGMHLKMRLEKDGITLDGIGFGLGATYRELSPDKPADIVYALEEDTWSGRKKIQLKLKDLKFNN